MPDITINNHSVHYTDTGTGPVLVFGHSYLWSSDMWLPQIKQLSQHYRCINIDLWDHGQSGHLPETINSIEDIADHIHEFLQQLNIDEYVVIGLSVGGMWGAALALNYPAEVKSLVLMDTFLGAEPEDTKQLYSTLIDTFEKAEHFSDPLLNQVIPFFFSPKALQQKLPIVTEYRHQLAKVSSSNIPGIANLGRIIFSRQSLLERFNEFKMPVLLMTGQYDLPRPPSEAKQMASLIRNSQYIEIENAGHISNLEQPEQVTEALETFLKTAFN